MTREFPTYRLHKALAPASARARFGSKGGYGKYWDAYTAEDDILHALIEQGTLDPPGEVSEDNGVVFRRIQI